MSRGLDGCDIWDRMKARYFNSLMPGVNEQWAADALGMTRYLKAGPDLIDSKKIIEVKFTLLVPESVDPNVRNRNYVSWRVLDHQVRYGKDFGMPFYFLMGTYSLDRRVRDINGGDSLGDMVTKRETWIVTPDWVDGFKTYRQTGRTRISEWENYIKFAKRSLLPRTYKNIRRDGADIHLTAGVKRSLVGG